MSFDNARAAKVHAAFTAQHPGKRLLAFAGDTVQAIGQPMAGLVQFLLGLASVVGDYAVLVHPGGVSYARGKALAAAKSTPAGDAGCVVKACTSVEELFAETGNGAILTVAADAAKQTTDFAKAVRDAFAAASDSTDAAADTGDAAREFIATTLARLKDDNATRKASALVTALHKRWLSNHLERIAAQPAAHTAEAVSKAIKEKANKANTITGLESMAAADFAAGFLPQAGAPLVVGGGTDMSFKTPKCWYTEARSSATATFAGATTLCYMYGVKHMGWVSMLARTAFLQDVAPETQKAYELLLALESALAKRLKPGAVFSKIREDAVADVRARFGDELCGALPDDLGGALSVLPHEPAVSLSSAGSGKVEAGMSVAVVVGLSPADSPAVGTQPVVLANTYTILDKAPQLKDGSVGPQQTLLTKIPQQVLELRVTPAPINDDDDAADNGAGDRKASGKRPRAQKGDEGEPVAPIITTRAARGVAPDMSAEQRRLDRLKVLLREKHETWITDGKPRGGANATASDEFRIFELGRLGKGDTVAYQTLDAAPANFLSLRSGIELDRAKFALWLPLNGADQPCTPIHVAAISKCEQRSAAQHEHYFTVTFHSTQESNYAFRANRAKVFVREATFCGPDAGKFYQLANGVKELQATIKARDTERKAKQGVVAQGGLRVSAHAERLPQVKCRPPPTQPGKGGRGGGGGGATAGCEGNLEAHENGFRFAYVGGHLDVLYENVKHMIVQPSKNDVLVVLHLALNNSIMVGGKKTDHVQFCAEVMEGTMAVTAVRHTHEEEMRMEERDADRIKKTNLQFVAYAKMAANVSGLAVEMPFSTINFEGSAHRGTVNFRGNERALWSIVEMPFFVLPMADIEVVALERVIAGNINFDLAFVGKDYRTVKTITTVPTSELEHVKDWLLATNTLYFEAGINISWASTLKQIREDPDWVPFGERGGWRTMMSDMYGDDSGDDEGEGGADADSDAYSDSDEDYDDDDEEEDDDDSDFDYDTDDESFDSDDSGASGDSWDSMERRAERSSSEDDSDDGRLKKKRHKADKNKKKR